jgi:hypothetical protein
MKVGRDLGRVLADPIDEVELDALLEEMIAPRLRAAAVSSRSGTSRFADAQFAATVLGVLRVEPAEPMLRLLAALVTGRPPRR